VGTHERSPNFGQRISKQLRMHILDDKPCCLFGEYTESVAPVYHARYFRCQDGKIELSKRGVLTVHKTGSRTTPVVFDEELYPRITGEVRNLS
jgi:hypothetical protein